MQFIRFLLMQFASNILHHPSKYDFKCNNLELFHELSKHQAMKFILKSVIFSLLIQRYLIKSPIKEP